MESRHAAWIRDLRGMNPAPDAAEPAIDGAARDRHPQGQWVREMKLDRASTRDGAIGEALDALHGTTRARVPAARGARERGAAGRLGRAGVGRGRAAATTAILNYALTLEYVQDSFYSEVDRIGALSGALAEQARVVGRPRARAREGVARGARLARGQAPALRLPRRDRGRGALPQDRGRLRGPRGRRLQGRRRR